MQHVRFVAAADELGSYEVKANYRTLGPLFGKDMPLAAEAIAALDPDHVAATDARRRRRSASRSAAREHTLTADDLLLTMTAPEGYSVEREGTHAVALDLAIDGDLRREGRAREIVHAVQSARKSAGLAIEDRIELALVRRPRAARRRRRPPRLPRRRDARGGAPPRRRAAGSRDGSLRADRDRRAGARDRLRPARAERASRYSGTACARPAERESEPARDQPAPGPLNERPSRYSGISLRPAR